MFLLLMRTRLLSAKNVARDSLQNHPLLSIGLSLLGVGLFLLVYGLFFSLFRFAARVDLLVEVAYQVFYLLLLFLFAGAVPFIASTLLQSSEYNLLFHAPVPPRTIIAAKLIDATVISSLQFTILGIPAIVACASALNLTLLGWLLVPLIILLFVLLPAILTALGLLILLGILGMRRIRSAITILNALMAIAVCVIFILETQRMPVRLGMLGTSITSVASLRNQTSFIPHIAPSAWFVVLLRSLSSGASFNSLQAGQSLLFIGALNGVVFGFCLLLGERLISAASVTEENEGGRTLADANIGMSGGWYRLFSPPTVAVLRKDLLYITRDSILLSQMMMPALLFIVPFLLMGRGSLLSVREELFPFASSMVIVILFMQSSILSLSSIGLEGRGFWQYLASPNGGRQLLWGKFVMSTGISGGISAIIILFTTIVCRVDYLYVLILPLFALLCASGLCAIGVGISASFPRFIYENPAHRVSTWAMILGFFGSMGYMVLTTLLFAGAWFATNFWEGNMATYIGLGVVCFHALLTLYIIFIALTIGAKRIEKYSWEH